ncbi:hypothetical protein FDZ71_11790, partial [bacterium]
MKKLFFAALSLLFLLPPPAGAELITKDTRWSGVVNLADDVLVCKGATLTIAAGTKVLFEEATSTKTDPSFWSPNTEIAVNGRLVVEGTKEEPVTFEPVTGVGGGIIAATGSEVVIKGARIARSEEGLLAAGGSMAVSDTEITGCDTGIVINRGAEFKAEKVKVSSCKVGGADMRNYNKNTLPPDYGKNGEKAEFPEFTYTGFDGVTFSGCADAIALYFNEQRFIYEEKRPAGPKTSDDPKGRVREFLGDYTVDGRE